METEASFFEWGFKGIVGLLLAVGAWCWKSLIGDVKLLERDQTDFKLHVLETYAKDSTLQSTLERLHGRIDIISADVKTLIKSVAENGRS